MPKKSRKHMFDNDSNDNKYYFEPDRIEHDDSALDSENELRSIRIHNRNSDSNELNFEENNTSFNNE